MEDHRKFGGNPEIDVSCQYLRFFMEDDKRLAEIEEVCFVAWNIPIPTMSLKGR